MGWALEPALSQARCLCYKSRFPGGGGFFIEPQRTLQDAEEGKEESDRFERANTYKNIVIKPRSSHIFITIRLKTRQYQDRESMRRLLLEPEEYCRRWVPVHQGKHPGERGYRAACVRELAKVAGIKESTIDINWGANFEKRPNYMPRLLRMADVINQLKQVLPLPPEFPFE